MVCVVQCTARLKLSRKISLICYLGGKEQCHSFTLEVYLFFLLFLFVSTVYIDFIQLLFTAVANGSFEDSHSFEPPALKSENRPILGILFIITVVLLRVMQGIIKDRKVFL